MALERVLHVGVLSLQSIALDATTKELCQALFGGEHNTVVMGRERNMYLDGDLEENQVLFGGRVSQSLSALEGMDTSNRTQAGRDGNIPRLTSPGEKAPIPPPPFSLTPIALG